MSPVSPAPDVAAPRTPVLTCVLGAALTVTLLSGCGVGLQAQTYKETGRQDSSSTDLPGLALRNLHVEAPLTTDGVISAGGSAVLRGSFVSTGSTVDTLTAITTDAASSVSLQSGGQPVASVPVLAGQATSDWSATLAGLTRPLRAGSYVTVTLTFTSAGRTTLSVPIQSGDNGLSQRTPAESPAAEGG